MFMYEQTRNGNKFRALFMRAIWRIVFKLLSGSSYANQDLIDKNNAIFANCVTQYESRLSLVKHLKLVFGSNNVQDACMSRFTVCHKTRRHTFL